jgi:uncharacterized protein (TIGR03067 family)
MRCLIALVLLSWAGAPGLVPAQDDDPVEELERLQGTWRVESMTIDGTKIPGDELTGRRVIVIDDRYVVIDGTRTIQRGRFRIDPSKTPKRIDTIPADGANAGKVDKGIYEINGDTLRLCYAPPGQDRPTEFNAEEGSGRWVSVDRRVGPEE